MDTVVSGGNLRLNARSARIADRMEKEHRELRIAVSRLEGGTRILDCGVDVPGGYEAGRRLAEACMGGLGSVEFTPLEFAAVRLPGLQVRTDHPVVSCMAAQYAGWAVQPDGYFAMGSGPLRAIARVESELFDTLRYGEPADGPGVLVLEGRTLPTPAVADYLARKAGLTAERLTLLIAPTASLAASVQISARVVETCLHKVMELGFDAGRVVSAYGTAPIAPVAKNDTRAIGRTNDCVLYGGVVHLTVRADDRELAELAPGIPSSASRDYGTPFYEIFQRYGGDFYKVDPHLFSPAEVYLTNLDSGRTFHAGGINHAVLAHSLLG